MLILSLVILCNLFGEGMSGAMLQWRVAAHSTLRDQGGTCGTSFSTSNKPGARYGSAAWVDGNNVYLYGGYGYGCNTGVGRWGDIFEGRMSGGLMQWRYRSDFTTSRDKSNCYAYGRRRSVDQVECGCEPEAPGSRFGHSVWRRPTNNYVWMFGGYAREDSDEGGVSGYFADFWNIMRVGTPYQNFLGHGGEGANPTARKNSPGTFSTDGTNRPGGRYFSTSWIHPTIDSYFYLFGGYGYHTSTTRYYLNDLYIFRETDKTINYIRGTYGYGTYGTTYSTSNLPGGRMTAKIWVHSDSEILLFGGYGYGSSGALGDLNDLWGIRLTDHAMRWITGSDVSDSIGIGEEGSWSSTHTPPALSYSTHFILDGIYYLIGGKDSSASAYWRDCWALRENGINNWEWMLESGSKDSSLSSGVWGTSMNWNNFPGGVLEMLTFENLESNGKVFLWGGNGWDSSSNLGFLQTLWEVEKIPFDCFGKFPGSGLECSANGNCIGQDICQCDVGFSGDECHCTGGYYGALCDNYDCAGLNYANIASCSYNNGTCIGPENCDCETGYGGDQCEYWYCDSIASNSVSVCGSHGACYQPNGCGCEVPYYGTYCDDWSCFGTDKDSGAVCNTHGVCDYGDHCTCNGNYYGSQCTDFDCFSLNKDHVDVCSGDNGTCVSPDSCSCVSVDYNGNQCQNWYCSGTVSTAGTVCSSHGQCTQPDHCWCDVGYATSMSLCNDWTCSTVDKALVGTVCNGHGTCTAYDTCECNGGYYGPNCEDFDCYTLNKDLPTACSGVNGTCVAPNTCSCISADYDGDQCENWYCDSKLSTDPLVCTSHGYCIAPDQCYCYDNYFSTLCNDWWCYGEDKDSSLACSGNGTCDYAQHCQCDEGYFGDECEKWACHSIPMNDPWVCNMIGECINPDVCACDETHQGSGCNTELTCFSVSWDSSSVCNSNGECERLDQCACDTGYSGTQCEDFTCWGVEKDSSFDVCNGEGTCVDSNTCECQPPYFGAACNVKIVGSLGLLITVEETPGYYGADLPCQMPSSVIGDSDEFDCSNHIVDLSTFGTDPTCRWKKMENTDKILSIIVQFGPDATAELNDVVRVKVPSDMDTIVNVQLTSTRELDEDDQLVDGTTTIVSAVLGVGISVVVIAGAAIMIVLACAYVRHKKRMEKNGLVAIPDIPINENSQRGMPATPTKKNQVESLTAHLNKELFCIDSSSVELQKQIGQGGGGAVVFVGKWKGLTVCAKIFRANVSMSGSACADYSEFEQEASLLASLRHPSLIRWYGAMVDPPRVGFIIEFCGNGDLRTFYYRQIDEGRDFLDIEDKLRILLEAASGIDYLHSKAIVHRDLKSDNILLDDDLHAKIIDFGISRSISSTQTRATKHVGTSYYMAPEVARGGAYGASCDVYSFSIIVYEIIAENFDPYGFAEGEFSIEMRVANDAKFRPRFTRRMVKQHRSIVKMMRLCWADNPDDRPTMPLVKQFFETELGVVGDDEY